MLSVLNGLFYFVEKSKKIAQVMSPTLVKFTEAGTLFLGPRSVEGTDFSPVARAS